MTLHARYTILRKIADGGTAEIFLATQHGAHGFEKPVVLKRIFPAFYADPQFRNMLVDEAHIAMSLNHSNIVQVLDLGEADGQYVLALDLVDGWTLDAVLRRARALNTTIPPALALYVTAEICRALAYAHAKTGADDKPLGIVHRDISPHNVLLSEQGEVKLTDFGIAKARNRRESSLGNMIKGKIAYMSPEQASGGELDARSDLFSVGTMLYVMVCGRYPFDAPTDLEMLLLVKNGECVPPEKARPGLNPEIYRVLKRAMAKTPADRYQRADEMLVDFEQVMRIAFRAVGQTELKRWLADLSMRDGVPPLTRAPPPASMGAGTAGQLAGETLELRGIGTTALPAPPATLPPPAPAARPNRVPAPMPKTSAAGTTGSSARDGSANTVRPPPPPAAMAVGKKTATSPAPPRPTAGPPPAASPSRVADDAADSATPKPVTKPAAPLPAKPIHAFVEPHDQRVTPRVPSAEGIIEEQPEDEVTAKTGNEKSGNEKSANEKSANEKSANERITAKVPVLEPPPPTPRKSSSWVAEAVAAAAQRAGTTPPPPVSPLVPAPPMILPAPHVTGDVRAPPTPDEPPRPPQARRLVIAAGVGLAAILVIGLSTRACGDKADDSHAAQKGQAQTGRAQEGQAKEAAPPPAAPVRPTPPVTAPVAVAPASAAADASSAPEASAPATLSPPTPTSAPDAKVSAVEATVPPAVEPATARGAPTVAGDAGRTGLPDKPDPDTSAARPAVALAAGAGPASDPETDGDSEGPVTATVPRVSVLLKSSPPGAEVGTPHHPFGTTPVSVKFKVGGTYALVFTRDGYRPTTKVVRVTSQGGQQVTATLRPAPSPPKVQVAPVPSQPAPSPAPKPAEKTWFQRMFAR